VVLLVGTVSSCGRGYSCFGGSRGRACSGRCGVLWRAGHSVLFRRSRNDAVDEIQEALALCCFLEARRESLIHAGAFVFDAWCFFSSGSLKRSGSPAPELVTRYEADPCRRSLSSISSTFFGRSSLAVSHPASASRRAVVDSIDEACFTSASSSRATRFLAALAGALPIFFEDLRV